MAKVTYLDPCKDAIHDALAEAAEDADIDAALLIVRKGDSYVISGGGLTTSDLCAIALLIDESARQALFGE